MNSRVARYLSDFYRYRASELIGLVGKDKVSQLDAAEQKRAFKWAVEHDIETQW